MEKLPPELVSEICQYLPTKDLSKFRLTSKRYCDIGAREHFNTLHLMFIPKSFENILEVSKQPELAKYVKEGFYEGGLLQRKDYHLWRSNAWNNMLGSRGAFSDRGTFSKTDRAKLKAAYVKYKQALEEQTKFENANSDGLILAKAFRNFSNLKAIGLELNNTGKSRSRAMKAAFRSTLALPGTVTFWSPFESYEFASGERELHSLLYALVAAKTKLESLAIKQVHWKAFGFTSGREKLLVLPIFAGLKHISINIYLLWDVQIFGQKKEPFLATKKRQELLSRAIRSAEGLESLELDFSNGDLNDNCDYDALLEYVGEVTVIFSLIAGQKTWPGLRTLSLTSLQTNEDFFVDFMARHAPSLKHLHLGNLWLSHGSWETTFQKMQALLKLEQFSIVPYPFVEGIKGSPRKAIAMGKFLGEDHSQILGDRQPLHKKLQDFFLNGGADPFIESEQLEPLEVHLSYCPKMRSPNGECICSEER